MLTCVLPDLLLKVCVVVELFVPLLDIIGTLDGSELPHYDLRE